MAAVATRIATRLDGPPIIRTLGKGAVPYKSKWKRATDVPLTRDNFLDLLHGRTPTIKQAGFLTPEECFEYEKKISHRLSPYKHNTGPLLRKVGVAQFEYQAQAAVDFDNRTDERDQYFADAAEWRAENIHEELGRETGVNAWQKVVDTLIRLMPDHDVVVASEAEPKTSSGNSRTYYFSGIFRALDDATHVHCDWSPYDSLTEDWIISKVTSQVVYNMYLAPVVGGRTFVHDVQWSEECLLFRDPASYGYHRDVTHGRQKAIVSPGLVPGDLCFFNSRNMHEVEKTETPPCPELGFLSPVRPRLTLSSFIGLLPAQSHGERPKLILWS